MTHEGELSEDERAILESINHIEQFLETLSDYDFASLSGDTRARLRMLKQKWYDVFSSKGKEEGIKEEHIDGAIGGGPGAGYGGGGEFSFLEVLADKLDTRKAPTL